MKLILAAAIIFTAIIQPCVTHSTFRINKLITNPSTALDIQGTRSLARYDQKFAISDLWISIKEKITEVWETITAIGASLIDKTKQWLDNLISKSKQVIEEARKQLEIYKSQFDVLIKDLKEKAYEIGLNIEECTEENKESIIKLLTDTLSTITQCISEKVTRGHKLLESTTEFVELETDLNNMLNDGLEKCGNAADIEVCLEEFIDDINGTALRKSQAFVVMENENRSLLEILGVALQDCLSENLHTIASQILEQTKEIVECVNKKMTNSNLR